MSSTTIAPEVREFLTLVRAQLADLDPDEQREILDGLEADLADLVAERGAEALGDPVAYARELRTAAGLEPMAGRLRHRVGLGSGAHALLDDAHRQFDRVIAALPGDTAGVVASLQPAWWVMRAWLAVEVTAYLLGEWSLQVVPGSNVAGALAILVAVVLSVQLGRRRIWPGARWRTAAGMRTLLLGLNVFAVLMVSVVLSGLGHARTGVWERGYEHGYQEGARSLRDAAEHSGVSLEGREVRNIYPYDAQGRPLTGIQLVDSSGRPLALTNDPYDEGTGWGDFVLVPWLTGTTEHLNVFPLAEQRFDQDTQERVGAPVLPAPPVASLPPVALKGVTPSRFDPASR